MTVETATDAGIAAVRAGFEAFAAGDPGRFAAMFRPDATWNHRNDDRFAGIYRGVGDIMSFLGESGELTAGTLRAEPLILTGDAAGHVCAVVRLSGTRPDGHEGAAAINNRSEVPHALITRGPRYPVGRRQNVTVNRCSANRHEYPVCKRDSGQESVDSAISSGPIDSIRRG